MADREDSPQNPSENMGMSAREYLARPERVPIDALAPSNVVVDKHPLPSGFSKFRPLLAKYNIVILKEDPPAVLIEQANKIISPPGSSFEMDEATARELRREFLGVAEDTESEFVRKLGPRLFPAMNQAPDQTVFNSNRLWDQRVAISLDPVPLEIPQPLPKPKPDSVFGYSKAAFTSNQQMAIDLLGKNPRTSYAMPAEGLIFSFLQFEFKAHAMGGLLFVAENQAASAGAIAMNGLLELYKRILAEEDIDMHMPQYFSVTMSQRVATLNVHWLSRSADGPISFHIALLQGYLLTDSNSIRAVDQAVKNILDYGVRTRLPRIRAALDRYYQKVVRERKTAIGGRESGSQAEGQQRPPRSLRTP